MIIIPPETKNLIRYKTPFGRLYSDGINLLPSVTTILGETEPDLSKHNLRKWAKNNQEAGDLARSRGNFVHLLLETCVKQSLEEALKLAELNNDPKCVQMFWSMYSFIERFKPISSELKFFLPQIGYAGTIDYPCICTESGLLTILDWKTSMKPKPAHVWGHNPLQLAAYMKAATVLLGQPFENGIIVRSCFDTPTQTYFMNKEQMEHKFVIFKRRRKEYLLQVKYWMNYNNITLEDIREE